MPVAEETAADTTLHSVLDKGEVLLIDHMGGDHKVYGSARVSTGKTPEESSSGPEKDQRLVKRLMKDHHGTPFEHAVFQWYVKAPIFVVREWMRHRAASYNEFSGRYAQFKAEFYIPDHARVVDPNNKQSTILSEDPDLKMLVEDVIEHCSVKAYERYEELLDAGIGREMARLVLPVNLYTQFWWTVNARNVMNFIALRNAPEAQLEIQMYAAAIEYDFAHLMPWTYEAFVEGARVAP